ncbi:hypothetical protein V494_07314 [Pseudogymnoascus sp. VKM F-4513 (FW-928)]|nr:hypothetical protein V494_07314 [Pseudogymnoascus sp. VKM F-4513 (FW-928)]
MKRLFRRSGPKPPSPGQALEAPAPTTESSNGSLGPAIVADVANAQVDIVFLHGLTGHRENTWTATGDKEPWPKALLPKDLPTARIIMYGYDADVVNLTRVAGQNTVREHATNLINELAANRMNAVGRPIIFVVHSLGGIVCQDALLVCNNPHEDAQTDILSSTCGVAFLGTPHAGSGMKSFATALANIVSLVKKPNKKLLEVLGKNSEVLANIENGFLTMVQRRLVDRQSGLKPIALHAFIEELPVDFLKRRVVEPDSAKIPGYNFDTIHANHMEMTKFRTASDPGYGKILNRLKRWIGDDDVSALLQYANNLRLKFETLFPIEELAKSEPPASAINLCKSSSLESSLEWFLHSPEFVAWNVGQSRKIWLHGEHSDGKTVTMSYIVIHSSQLIPFTSDGKSPVSIFCSRNDSEVGLLVSIALQLLQYKARAIASQSRFPISKSHPEGGRLGFNRLLWGLIKDLINGSQVTVLIIDGIDKLESSVRASFLDKFGRIEKEALKRTDLRVIISSERLDDIGIALSHYSSIDRERERRECLKALEFNEWNAREIGVQKVEKTGREFFRNEEYLSWIKSKSSSVLWLEGKPGSGKSTLVKFMVDKLERGTFLREPRRRGRLQERDSPRERYSSQEGDSSQDSDSWPKGSSSQERNHSSVEIAPDSFQKRSASADRYSLPERDLSQNNSQKSKNEWVPKNPADKSIIVSRFYYSFRGGNTQTSHELMVRSIVYQIWSENSRLFPLIRDLYRERNPVFSIPNRTPPLYSYEGLKSVLKCLHEIDFTLAVFIIVDGMDESNNNDRVDVLKFLLGLTTTNPKSPCTIKVCIASRPENNINSRLRLVPHHIRLQEENKGDIRAVIDGWIERMVSNSGCGEDTLLEVKDYITKYAVGVFMWVTLVLRDLEQYIEDGGYTKLTLNARLRSLPKELGGKDGFYRAMINSLVERYKDDPEQQERGRRILAWVTFAERPISVTELQDALATPLRLDGTDLSTYVLEDNRPHQLDKAIMAACGGLVEIIGAPFYPIIQLIHQTAREFLLHEDKLAEPYHLEEVRGDMEIAMSCCRYLRIVFHPDIPPLKATADSPEVEIPQYLMEKPLLVYVFTSFQAHINHLKGNGKEVQDEFIDFVELLIKRSDSFATLLLGQWIQALGWAPKPDISETLSAQFAHSLLSYAAEIEESGDTRKGKKLAAALLCLRSDLPHIESGKVYRITTKQVGGDTGHNPKYLTTWTSLEDLDYYWIGLQLLHDIGADLDSKDTVGRTPLSYAAGNGHYDPVELLLNMYSTIDVNSRDTAGRTPLSYAAENGHHAVVIQLLQRGGGNINLGDTAGRTPLSYAAEHGHEGFLKLLLDIGANADLADSSGQTPLSYATANGNTTVVKLLQSYIAIQLATI